MDLPPGKALLAGRRRGSEMAKSFGKLKISKKPAMATYSIGSANCLLSGEVVEEIPIDGAKFLPYAYYKYDY